MKKGTNIWLSRGLGKVVIGGTILILALRIYKRQISENAEYKPYTVKSTKNLSETCKRIAFEPCTKKSSLFDGLFLDLEKANDTCPSVAEALKTKPIVYISIKQPQMQIQRPYTPIGCRDSTNKDNFEILVKRYQDGDVSRWLHTLKSGDVVEIKGPIDHYKYKDIYKFITFVVGGTGIAPAIQLIESCLKSEQKRNPEFQVIYACKSLDECVMMNALSKISAKHPQSIKVDIFLDQSNLETSLACKQTSKNTDLFFLKTKITKILAKWIPTNRQKELQLAIEEEIKEREINGKIGFSIHSRPLDSSNLRQLLPDEKRNSDDHLALICGPQGFVNWIAGKSGGFIGHQGQKGGLLMDVKNIFKL